ncbi:hypothetical protein P8452_68286 [Trifolium repens]|nr:hypothetical protein P8452_68286 [Trifolium repens]
MGRSSFVFYHSSSLNFQYSFPRSRRNLASQQLRLSNGRDLTSAANEVCYEASYKEGTKGELPHGKKPMSFKEWVRKDVAKAGFRDRVAEPNMYFILNGLQPPTSTN